MPDRDDPLPADLMALHDAAVAAGRPTYRDPGTGAEVFTTATLRARGACCGSGCRHCPYPPQREHDVRGDSG